MRRLGDGLEAEAFVPLDLPCIGAEADRSVAARARPVEQRLQQLSAGALAATARHDGDRQLRRLLVDEAEPRLVRREEPVPGGAVRMRPVHRDDPGVAGPAPVPHVAVDRAFGLLGESPVIRVAEHVAVETPGCVEIANAVPDRRPGQHYSARPGSSRNDLIVFRNSAPVAPSTARWSQVSVIVIIGRTCRSPSTGTTWSRVAPTARIDACGGLRTATNWSTSNMPRFEIVNVPPSRSSARSFASRARPTRSPRTCAICESDSCSALCTTGTTSPCGAATAMPTFAFGNESSASSVYCTFIPG